jgi:hypothetical protein
LFYFLFANGLLLLLSKESGGLFLARKPPSAARTPIIWLFSSCAAKPTSRWLMATPHIWEFSERGFQGENSFAKEFPPGIFAFRKTAYPTITELRA